MKRYTILPGIIIFIIFTWGLYILLMPMSESLVRYLTWTMTPAAAALRGSVDTGDTTIHYVSYGSGPAILLLHGGLSNRLSWFSQIPLLTSANRQIIVPDTRGHGRSGIGSNELNYRLLASDAIHVLDKLNITQADVIGWSDGGNTALLLGCYWPQRVSKIVVISANFSPSGLTSKAQEDTRTYSSGLTYWIKSWWTGAGRRLGILEKRIKRMWRTLPVMQSAELKEITTPVLVIIGKNDDISIDHAQQMASLLPHAHLDIIPGGHATLITQSDLVNQAISEFLELSISNRSAKIENTHDSG